MSEAGQLSFSLALEQNPVDALARTRAINEHDRVLLVEAGAGSGKTSVLVDRIVALVASGHVELRELAAITFTDAAALELRERLQRGLGAHLELSVYPERFARALDQLDDAMLGTIHGFAHRVLQEFALEAGLPLRFEVLDEIRASLEFDRRFSAFLDQLFDEEASRTVLAAAMALGVTPARLRELMVIFSERMDQASAYLEQAPAADLAEDLGALVGLHARALGARIEEIVALGAECLDEQDNLYQRVIVLGAQRALLAREDWLDALSALVQLPPQRVGRTGRAALWADGGLERARATFSDFEAARAAAIEEIGARVAAALAARLASESLAWAAARQASGQLSFEDLLVRTRALLVDNLRVRRILHDRYREILIDEFQDTDPLQLDIVALIRNAKDERAGLFFVGDPRQSIYRFRGAGLLAYETAQRELLEEPPLQLVTNYRSRPGVLAFVNEVFATLAQDDTTQADAFSTPLVAARAADPTEAATPVVLVGEAHEQLRAHERRVLEADDLAAAITTCIATPWMVEREGSVAPARYRDIAVLVPRRTGLAELESALESAGVPFRVASSTLVYASSEVRELLACLQAICFPADERAVVTALRSVYFALSDQDLYEHRAKAGSWAISAPSGPRASAPELEEDGVAGTAAVRAALARLARYHELAPALGPLGLFDAFCAGEAVHERLALSPRPRESLRRGQFLRARVQAFCEAGGASLTELLAFIERERQTGVRGVEAMPDDGEDAVRILTIHGAKGLEFPIVALAELGGASRAWARGANVLSAPDGRVEVRISSSVKTRRFGELVADEAALERAEDLRLCYVGATRARDHLIVSLHHKTAAGFATKSLAERLAECCAKLEESAPQRLCVDGPVRGMRAGEADTASQSEAVVDYLAAYATLTRQLERRLRRASVAASALGPRVDSERTGAPIRPPAPVESAWERRPAATAIGRAVHAVLQRVDLDTGVDLALQVQRAVREQHCEGESTRVAELATRVLDSPVLARARRATRCYRELPMSTIVDGTVLESVLDLCFVEDDGFVIVDYKTDALGAKSDLAAHAERYRLQVGAYVLALGAVQGLPVARVVLVFAGARDNTLEYEVPDLAGAAAAARAAIGALQSATTAQVLSED